MGRIVAIDYGRARIGLAMTDEKGSIALPFKTLAACKKLEKSVDALLENLKSYLPKIDKFVLGFPLLLSGKKGDMAFEVEQFKALLEKKTAIPVILWDERLTSAQADNFMKEMNLSRKKRSQQSDSIAAIIILQNYLDAQNI